MQSSAETAEIALEIAATVAEALPPPWDAAAPITTVISGVLKLFFSDSTSPSQAPTLEQIVGAMRDLAAEGEIKDAKDQITTLLQNFISQTNSSISLPPSIDYALNQESSGVFSTLYHFLHDTVTGVGNGELWNAITSMATDQGGDVCKAGDNLQARYLPTFVYGVSTYVLLAKYWVSLAYSVNRTLTPDMLSLDEVINQLGTTQVEGQPGWIGYADMACRSFEAQVEARLNQVGLVTPFSYHPSLLSGEYFVAYFTDNGSAVDGFDKTPLAPALGLPSFPGAMHGPLPVKGGGYPPDLPDGTVYQLYVQNEPPAYVPVQQLRQAYVEQMREVIYANYFDVSKMQQTITHLREALGQLQAAKAKETTSQPAT